VDELIVVGSLSLAADLAWFTKASAYGAYYHTRLVIFDDERVYHSSLMI
jgi:hypothetical protein